eukprot:gene340-6754_t
MIRLLSIAKKNKLSFVERKYSKFHEGKYQKMTPLEHVLNRPDVYVGSIQKKKEKNWIFENNKIIEKEIEFSPGLYRTHPTRKQQRNYISNENEYSLWKSTNSNPFYKSDLKFSMDQMKEKSEHFITPKGFPTFPDYLIQEEESEFDV